MLVDIVPEIAQLILKMVGGCLPHLKVPKHEIFDGGFLA
jgi:hypothetical protein